VEEAAFTATPPALAGDEEEEQEKTETVTQGGDVPLLRRCCNASG